MLRRYNITTFNKACLSHLQENPILFHFSTFDCSATFANYLCSPLPNSLFMQLSRINYNESPTTTRGGAQLHWNSRKSGRVAGRYMK